MVQQIGNKVSVIDDTAAPGSPLTKTETKKAVYPFVDLVRFIATIGIVFIHTEAPSPGQNFEAFLHHVHHVEYYLLLRQIFKFSTICYFLIAGFLLADKTLDTNPFKYYLRRLNIIAKPYLLALLIFITILVITTMHTFQSQYVFSVIKFAAFYTPFWYVPNYLLCLLIIVGFYKYASSLYFGGLLFLITLSYSYFDVYSATHTGSHTTALFGFVFYMWLGVYIKKSNLVEKIKQISPVITGAILLLLFVLCNLETHYLFYHTHTHDSLNTLRISNQLYSVAFFVFIISLCTKKPNFGIFNPRKETYGIYLYHSFFFFFVIPYTEAWISPMFNINLVSYNIYHLLALTFINFIICYLASTAFVKLLLRFKLAYLPNM
jgi:hypothetical protein